MMLSRILEVGAAAVAACVMLSGCLVSAPPVRSVSVAYEEEPLYHDGYSVQFDTSGLPYVYVGRTARYVPRSHPRYAYYVNHRPRQYERPYRAHGRDGRRPYERTSQRHYERY
jgi:hypothetical protein